jgi:hypothetical protein
MTREEAKKEIEKVFEPAFANYIIEALTKGATVSDRKSTEMTREEQLDWLCRLRSEIYAYMPKEWLIPMNDALDMAIETMCKYQKIQEIVNAPIGGTSAKYTAIVNLIKYSEVDKGNDN